jgi:thymidylate kinase
MDGGTGENIVLHKRVRAGYLEMVEHEPSRWVVTDAGKDWQTVPNKLREVMEKSIKK